MHVGRKFVVTELVAFALLVLALLCSTSSLAGDDFPQVSAEEVKMTTFAEAPGASAVILYRQVDRDDSQVPTFENNYYRIKILTEEGRKYADIEIPFIKEAEKDVVQIKARTVQPDGSIKTFDGQIFDKTLVKAKGLKYRAKTFTLPNVQPGSIVEYSYRKYFGFTLYNAHWIVSADLFTKRAKFSMKPYDRDPSLGIQWISQGLPAGNPGPQRKGNDVIRLEVVNIPAFHAEDYMPPEDELKAHVGFIYTSNRFDSKDSDKFWKEVGKYDYDYLENYQVKHKGLEQAVSQIVSPGDSPQDKLQKTYARVQKLRNTSFEREKTEQEHKREKDKTEANVIEVWQRGYGSRKQLNLLFLSMAWASGLEAYYVEVPRRDRSFFYAKAMNTRALSQSVVVVKLNGTDVFFDPGSLYTPFGQLPWQVTGMSGLKLDKTGGTWIQIPMPASAESRVERTANLKLSESGDLEGKLSIKYTGQEALVRRVEERDEDQTQRKKFLEEQAKGYIPAGTELDLTNQPDWTGSDTPLVAEFNLKVPGWVSVTGHKAFVPVGLFGGSEKHVFDHSERVHPIYFEFPFQKIDDLTIELPAGWRVTSLPPLQNQASKVIGYTMKAENDGAKIHLKRTIDVGLLMVGTDNYQLLRSFFQVVRTSDEAQIVLQADTATASK
ncbi:MAG TPA: DUF3857 domain-containing protein [Terriglobales bacterium]